MDMEMGANPEEMPPMGNETPDMGDEELPTEFGGNFDAGVEADEETDPKKYIQQLTGKLSQSLNSYNNENGEPDIELGKYVLGMLIKQAVKGMEEKDKKELIKKINTDDTETDELPEDDIENAENEGDNENEMPEMSEMPMESKVFKLTKSQIFESLGLPMDSATVSISNIEKKGNKKITPDTVRNRRTRPFEAPKKFKI